MQTHDYKATVSSERHNNTIQYSTIHRVFIERCYTKLSRDSDTTRNWDRSNNDCNYTFRGHVLHCRNSIVCHSAVDV